MTEERLSWYATAAFAVTAVAALGISALRPVAAVVALAMFFSGAGAMAAALVIGAGRSREVLVDIGGLFFTQAPQPLRYAMFAQIAIGLGTAFARPYTSSAFGVLAPMAGLGLCGLWGARHGTFPPRET